MNDTFYFDPTADDLSVFMGPTEAHLMHLAWTQDHLSVKRALSQMDGSHAYTTVMTVMNRLANKGLLSRKKDGRHFVYSPTLTRDQFLTERIDRIRACLKRNFDSTA